uniref:C-type lectin n=2 Tax=Nyssomyia TaxID=252611 RepID=J7HHU4_9DIPT
MVKLFLTFFFVSFLTMCTAQNLVVRKLPSGKTIYISKTYMSWYEGLDFCNRKGMSLVSIANDQENRQLSNVLQKILPEHEVHCWIGGYKFQDENGQNSMRWINGGRKVDYTNFAGGEPNNDKEYCLEMYYRQYRGDTARWNDRYCTDRHPFVCEKKC